MEKRAAEDDCEDSGAETGGSDYSRMSSTSSELSVDDIQDPFLVSIHIIADPGEAKCLQDAIDKLLAWIHPDLQLFRVSERRISKKRKLNKGFPHQPALAAILFLQEEYGEEQILHLHECFQKPPWQFHHTERVHGRFLPYLPCNQDFFTLAHGTPLWAIRQVHYGKEIIRFTIYCSYENFTDMMKMYEMILKKSVYKKKADFCVFPIYSNMDIDIEFSLKRLLKGQTPVPLDSSLLEFRVKEFGQLIPLLPNQCSPISEGRWQTEDHDGNKILLQQVHRLTRKSVWKHQSYLSNGIQFSMNRHDQKHKSEKSRTHLSNGWTPSFEDSNQNLSKTHMQITQQPKATSSATRWFQRSKSLLCLPTLSSFPSCESFPFSEPLQVYRNESQTLQMPVWRSSSRINVDDLEGAQETDVDTGMKLSSSDLSVVSAYSPLDGLSGDLEPSLPSHREFTSQNDGFVAGDRLCEFSYELFHSISERSSSSLVSSVFPSVSSNTSLEFQKDNTSHYKSTVDVAKHMPESASVEEEEFFI